MPGYGWLIVKYGRHIVVAGVFLPVVLREYVWNVHEN
jgi:AMMECR1 domain-containing protein